MSLAAEEGTHSYSRVLDLVLQGGGPQSVMPWDSRRMNSCSIVTKCGNIANVVDMGNVLCAQVKIVRRPIFY